MGVFLMELPDVRHGFNAWFAVERPEIENNNFAAERLQCKRRRVNPYRRFADLAGFIGSVACLRTCDCREQYDGCGLRQFRDAEHFLSYDFVLESRWLGADCGLFSFGYQYCKWHFSHASSIPFPTSRSFSLSFASIAVSASIVASCKPWAYLIQLVLSLLIISSICSGASSTLGSSAFSPGFAT